MTVLNRNYVDLNEAIEVKSFNVFVLHILDERAESILNAYKIALSPVLNI